MSMQILTVGQLLEVFFCDWYLLCDDNGAASCFAEFHNRPYAVSGAVYDLSDGEQFLYNFNGDAVTDTAYL